MRKIAAFIILTLFLSNCSYSQAGESVYDFLRLDMSARAAALGGSFNSNADDPDVIFYNPAGLGLLSNTPVSFSYFKHLLDINLASFAISKEYKGIGRFGAAVKYINYGSFTGADENANKTGDFSASEVAFILGYSNKLDENFYYGANIKFIYSGISSYSSTGMAVDLGLHYSFPAQQVEIGASALNLGGQLSKYGDVSEDLPVDVQVGISKKMSHLPLRVSLDFHRLNQSRDNFFQKFKAFSIGGEFLLSKVLTLRLGYDNERRSDLKIGTFAGMAGFNIGFGVKIKDYKFDYGYSSMGQIGSFNRIGVSTIF